MIHVNHVTVRFRLANDRINSLKEYVVQMLKRSIKYSVFYALSDVSFDVQHGEVLGIIGRNGAGKSTLLKAISGIIKPLEGSIQVNGNVVPLLELGSGFDFDLTGRENIFLNGALLGYSKSLLESKYQEIVDFSELGMFIDHPIRNYSSGMLVRLAFSIATIIQPEILIVDEILAVGDENFQRKSKDKMIQLMKGGATVLFVSHNLGQIREICNRVVWLEKGQVKAFGETEEICDLYQSSNN